MALCVLIGSDTSGQLLIGSTQLLTFLTCWGFFPMKTHKYRHLVHFNRVLQTQHKHIYTHIYLFQVELQSFFSDSLSTFWGKLSTDFYFFKFNCNRIEIKISALRFKRSTRPFKWYSTIAVHVFSSIFKGIPIKDYRCVINNIHLVITLWNLSVRWIKQVQYRSQTS